MKHFDPRKANLLPDVPASRVSRLRACGFPSVAAGSCWRLGSIPKRNVVVLDPQSKCFFAWLNCRGGMPIPVIQVT